MIVSLEVVLSRPMFGRILFNKKERALNITLNPKEEHRINLGSMHTTDNASILTHPVHPKQLNPRHSTEATYLYIIPQQQYESHTTITTI